MKDDNLKWYFPTSINIAGRGENDPQRELFPGDARQTLVRESIQNSLDHHNPQAGGPLSRGRIRADSPLSSGDS